MCGSEHRQSHPLLPLCAIGAPSRRGQVPSRFGVKVGASSRGPEDRSLAMIRLTGELDTFVAGEIGDPLREFVDFARDVVIDMAGIDFIDSEGLRLVEDLGESARAAGGSVRLHDPSPVVVRLMELLDAGDRFDVCRPDRGRPYGRHPAGQPPRRSDRKTSTPSTQTTSPSSPSRVVPASSEVVPIASTSVPSIVVPGHARSTATMSAVRSAVASAVQVNSPSIE